MPCFSALQAGTTRRSGEILRARERDPIGVSGAVNLGAVYYNLRRFDEAYEALRRAIELDPSAPSLWMWTGMVDGARGQFNYAVTAFEKAIALGDDTAAVRCYHVYSLARGGRRPDALRVLAELEQSGRFVPAPALAIAYAGLGDRERALQLLESGFRSRDRRPAHLTWRPISMCCGATGAFAIWYPELVCPA